MSQITLIVAVDAARGIGLANQMPWHLPEDLAHFKRLTSGHPIVMGRKTFDSIGRALPGRRNIVITRNAAWQHDGVERAGSLAEALAMCDDAGSAAPVFVIGGGQIFAEALAMDLASTIELTEIGRDFGCDTFFPALVAHDWSETARARHHCDAGGYDYSFITLQRKFAS